MAESELQGILPGNDSNLSIQKYDDSPYYAEYWEFLLMMGLGDFAGTEKLYEKIRQTLPPNDWRMPLLEIGEARFLSISGRQFLGFRKLQLASELIFSNPSYPNGIVKSEILSLYYYVFTSVQEKIGDQRNHLPLLSTGRDLTSNENFKLAFDYTTDLILTRNYSYPISQLILATQKMEAQGLRVLACIGYRNIAIAYQRAQDFKSAKSFYKLAMSIAHIDNFTRNEQQILNAEGFGFFLQGETEKAASTYRRIKIFDHLDPIIPILYENQALIAEKRGDVDLAVSKIKAALEVSTELDFVNHTSSEFLFLGEKYENHYADLEQAEHYYKRGYDCSMRYAEHGISLTGDRKAVVDAYLRLITSKDTTKEPASPEKPKDHFAFAQGKAWKDIKDIFQHQLIQFHGAHRRNSKQLADKLSMPASTLYSLQDRLKQRGYLLHGPQEILQTENLDLGEYLEAHESMTWEEINKVFEREMMHYLYEKYGYNKHRMASILELSYPSIISKTRELTQVDDHFLTN